MLEFRFTGTAASDVVLLPALVFSKMSLHPVNRMLEFGFTGISASDVVLLPALV